MSRRAVRRPMTAQIDFGYEHRGERFHAREPHEHAVERSGHACRPRAFPCVSGKRGLDECRHRGGLDALSRYVTQNHDSLVVGQT